MGWIADLLKEIPSAARYKVELDGMEKENASLKAENVSLKLKIDALTALKAFSSGFDPDAEKILVYIARRDYDSPSGIDIKSALSLTGGVTNMHLEDLMTEGYIGSIENIYTERRYCLMQPGRRYLHDKGLL
jgi:hypothetical protein